MLLDDAATLIDSAVRRRVLVFGSLPPDGRDLDILARPPEAASIAEALPAAGFRQGAASWVRFGDCSALAVEIVPADDWGLPVDELEALLAEAVPVAGYSRLVEPAAHHQLLILARKIDAGTPLTSKRRGRAERLLRTSSDARHEARRRAPAWEAQSALAQLEEALDRKGPPRRRALRHRRPHRLRLVSLSGIDGAGKSSQAKALKHALDQLGYEAEIVWTPIAQEAWTQHLAEGIRLLLLQIPSLRPSEGKLQDARLERDTTAGPGTLLRERSGLATEAWTTFLALANGFSHARAVLRHGGRRRVIIFDRYVLDSAVRLRVMYGESRDFRWQTSLIRLLSPEPLASFFLDVAPETALTRKQDRWTAEGLSAHARLYRNEHAAFGALRIDGEAPVEEICAQIAEAVWERLPDG